MRVAHPVGAARTFDKCRGKAVTTAESALSHVETARLAAEQAGRGNTLSPWLSTVVGEAEEGLVGVQGLEHDHAAARAAHLAAGPGDRVRVLEREVGDALEPGLQSHP